MLLIGLVLAGGCAAKPNSQPADRPVAAVEPVYDDDAVAAALAFDPAVTHGEPPVVLARDNRGIQAFAGYDTSTTTYYFLRLDDRQNGAIADDFERRVISHRIGITQR